MQNIEQITLEQFASKFDYFLFDCDGVLWYGAKQIGQAFRNIEYLESIGKKVYFVTNSSLISREDLAEMARKPIGKSIWDLGVDVASGDILTLLLTSLNPGGAVACSGLVGGASFESSIFPFILRGNALLGIDSVEIPLEQKSQIWGKFSSDWKLDLADLTKEVSLEGLEKEIQTILQGGQVGRIVVNLT